MNEWASQTYTITENQQNIAYTTPFQEADRTQAAQSPLRSTQDTAVLDGTDQGINVLTTWKHY